MIRSSFFRLMLVLSLMALFAGCGAYRMPPVDPRSVDSLKAETEDADAGMVGVAPGFNVKAYEFLVVEPFRVAPGEIKDEEDIRLAKDMSAYFHGRLLAKLGAASVFPRVIDANVATEPSGNGPALRLRGDITRLTEGSQALRYFVGFGAGAAKAQIEARFIDDPSQEVRLITADRRAAGMGIFGGDGRQFVTESMDQMADGLVRFLRRLAAGEQPAQR